METAWSLIGTEHLVRIKGGRAIYEAVDNATGDRTVRLQRMEVPTTATEPIRVITRYVDPDTEMEIMPG